jgi:hypothetical protein
MPVLLRYSATDDLCLPNHRQHVYNDLEPYVCLFSDCDLGLHTFRSRREWRNHEFYVHRVSPEWPCNLCQEKFETQEIFRHHIGTMHENAISLSQIEEFLSSSRRLIPCKVESQMCPFCQTTTFHSHGGFASHVGKHQQEISLAALPRLADNSDDEGIDDGKGSDSDDSSDSDNDDDSITGVVERADAQLHGYSMKTAVIRGDVRNITDLRLDPVVLAELPEANREEALIIAIAERQCQATSHWGKLPPLSTTNQALLDSLPRDLQAKVHEQVEITRESQRQQAISSSRIKRQQNFDPRPRGGNNKDQECQRCEKVVCGFTLF